jgi:transposase-like protein
MTKKKDHRKVHTREFKLQPLEMAETSGKSVAQIENKLGPYSWSSAIPEKARSLAF